MKYEQAIVVIAHQMRALDGTWKVKGALETAVCDFQLLVRDAFAVKGVAAASADAKAGAAKLYLKVVRLNARQIHLDDPAVLRAVHVRVRTPQTIARGTAPAPPRHQKKIALNRFS